MSPTYSHCHLKEISPKLKVYQDFLQSCIGPNGKAKIIQNLSGGPIIVTTSSQIFMRNIPVSFPILKVLNAACKNLLNTQKDYGLFMLVLSTKLLSSSLDLPLHGNLISELYDTFGMWIMNLLNDKSAPIKLAVSFDEIQPLICIVKNILTTKPVACLSDKETKHVTMLLIRGFLKSFDLNKHGEFNRESYQEPTFVTHQGPSPLESSLINGLLIEKKSHYDYRSDFMLHLENVKFVLFGISLSGDCEEDRVNEGLVSSTKVDLTKAVLGYIQNMCTSMVGLGVKVIACQKVIHPSIKKQLEDKHIIAMDRVGEVAFKSLVNILGVPPILSLNADVKEENVAAVKDIKVLELQGKPYWKITSAHIPAVTFYICNRSEESLEEMKVVCEQAFWTLVSLLRDPTVVPGAGCLEVILAQHVRTMSILESKSLVENFSINENQLRIATARFASCLEGIGRSLHPSNKLPLVDSSSHHLWLVDQSADDDRKQPSRCACGLVSDNNGNRKWRELCCEPDVVDSLKMCAVGDTVPLEWTNDVIVDVATSKAHAYEIALECSNSLTRVGSFIINA